MSAKIYEQLESCKIKSNLSVPELVKISLEKENTVLAANGSLRVATGKFTGRSPNDKFIVDDAINHHQIDWGNINKPLSQEKFNTLYKDLLEYLSHKELYVYDGFAGADETYKLPVRVINEFAWQNIFIQQLLIRPTEGELNQHKEQFTLICAPDFQANPAIHGTNSSTFIVINFGEKLILIGGTHYAGEMKKSIFSIMNYLLPQQNVLSMHCSANVGENNDVALFFGLSGTGKTTLSADPNRRLIGDDEHGWSENGIFNIEGGCYAKCIGLTEEAEPQIWNAIKHGSVLENVVLDQEKQPNYSSSLLTENTRAAYPIEYIPNAKIPGVGGHPNVIIFLTADAFGVLPPIAQLTKDQAMYHFLSGYTSKLAGTERGITEPEATFSACFGAPFLPLSPVKYAQMLGEKLDKYNTKVYLVNTGWTGGAYGVGNRMKLSYTRAMVTAALDGTLEKLSYTTDPIFGLAIPESCPMVPVEVLNPRNTWEDKNAYDKQAKHLADLFAKNVEKFSQDEEAPLLELVAM